MNRAALLLFAVTSATLSAAATNITYYVNQAVGTGTVTGSIVTDGTIGVLSQADILDWKLLLNEGVTGFYLLGPLSGSNSALFPSSVTGLSATATQLLFNFSSGTFGISDPSLDYRVCFSSIVCISPSGAGVSFLDTNSISPNIQFTSLSGTQVIAATAAATPKVTYYVNLPIGTGSVTGDIVTDGKIGILGQIDIIDWNLVLNVGANSFDLLGPMTGTGSSLFGFSGSDLSATATQLLFNFSGTDSGSFEISDGSLDYDVCFSTTSDCKGAGETIIFMTSFGVFNDQFMSLSGTQVIATASAGTAQTITFGQLSNVMLGVGSFTITATASSGLAVSFSSTTGSVCTVSGNTVTIIAVGTCSITVNQSGNANYAAATPVTQSFTVSVTGTMPAFFNGEVSLGSGVYYLQFQDGNVFGYYNFPSSSILYHYNLGFEGFVAGSGGTVYLYDFTSNHWWYTSNALFPYLYDFTLNTWLYYFPNTTNPRYFSNLTTDLVFTM